MVKTGFPFSSVLLVLNTKTGKWSRLRHFLPTFAKSSTILTLPIIRYMVKGRRGSRSATTHQSVRTWPTVCWIRQKWRSFLSVTVRQYMWVSCPHCLCGRTENLLYKLGIKRTDLSTSEDRPDRRRTGRPTEVNTHKLCSPFSVQTEDTKLLCRPFGGTTPGSVVSSYWDVGPYPNQV